MRYWNKDNQLGGGALWQKLALGSDLYTGDLMFVESPILQDLLTKETHGYYHIKKVQWSEGVLKERFMDIWVLNTEKDEKVNNWLKLLSETKQEVLCCYTCDSCGDPLKMDPYSSVIDNEFQLPGEEDKTEEPTKPNRPDRPTGEAEDVPDTSDFDDIGLP